MKRKVDLYDTYLTDISSLGAVVILKEEGKKEYFSRTYQKGEIHVEDMVFDADCISFATGNVQILSLWGDKNELSSFLKKLYMRQERRRPILMLRKFLQYLGLLSSVGIGMLSFYFLCCGNVGKFFIGFVIVFFLRLLYSESRNLL